jgi:NAD(P)-dependent dehydrogenase (short-subunit alcohol dehydrogenase family)
MASLIERHRDRIHGVLSCFDRVVIRGTLPSTCHPQVIVNVASGGAFMRLQEPPTNTAYPASKAAHRFSEVLAASLAPQNVFVFSISPGLVRTAMTEGLLGDDAPWTPPECAPRLVRALAPGEFDALAGRYLHAERDPPETLRTRIEAIIADDLNAVRLRR